MDQKQIDKKIKELTDEFKKNVFDICKETKNIQQFNSFIETDDFYVNIIVHTASVYK
jgi:hypothetical protein